MYVLSDGIAVLKFPYSLHELREDNLDTSFPSSMSDEELSAWHVFPVKSQKPPSFDSATQRPAQADPVKVGDNWVQVWKIINLSPQEILSRQEEQSSAIRTERNMRLSACDWTQLSDAPVDAVVWALYRQVLRDIPHQTNFPWDVVWPTQPKD